MRWWSSALVCCVAASAQEVPFVGVPAALHERLAPWWQQRFGPQVELRPVADWRRAELAAGILWLADEWSLAWQAAHGGLAAAGGEPPFVVCWQADCVLAVGADVAARWTPAEGGCTWEDVALQPLLHDRLRLVGPEVDGGPWLAMMRHRLVRGDGETAGRALWTTIDARAGALSSGYGDGTGGPPRDGAWILPRHLLASGDATVAHPVRDSQFLLGVGLGARAGATLRPIYERLCARETVQDVARMLALRPVDALDRPLLDGLRATEWAAAFESSVRGRGRAVERLADGLDVVFGAALLVVLGVWWWRGRASRAH